ncbi:DUF2264 domain-containing protein [Mucilaginibacter sp. UR6-1]|uniref:DUF2264 domain-containing protein n=1 Tax=Mucilaginibacter sp. UR6-1 TaxID=1435643 RepID=UPI001E5C0F27|nr:DUF2264 domain-containing protein [Mucilaginibacter sp. UR6-1]MCC8408315.1 DUF2264 domain-containing protein [Mucilaginibacter sp. UR6-1]
MQRYLFLLFVLILCFSSALAQQKGSGPADRKLWLQYMDKVARPVMYNLGNDQLKKTMPVKLPDNTDNRTSRTQVAYLEAFGRTLNGIAPWLQLEVGNKDEVALRKQYRTWAIKALANAVDSQANDHMQWSGGQPLVDASFLAYALVRCPWLWENSTPKVKQQLIDAFKTTRNTIPVYSNWILFSAMIETFFCRYDLPYDAVRTEYAIREFTEHWYVGDGLYSDGMSFNLDYYNSIVIHPFLSTILDVLSLKNKRYQQQQQFELTAGKRYAQILERLINTDGSYPALGRSIVYRGGVFHHLANMAYTKQLPQNLSAAQVRGALTAVITKTLGAPKTFTGGWLNIGLYGQQPGLADFYITTGSLYICSTLFLPLGLPESDEFWSSTPEPWTAVKIWSGQNADADHALEIKK